MHFLKKIFFYSLSCLLVVFTCYLLSEWMLGAIPNVPWNTPKNWTMDPQIGPWNKSNYKDGYRTSEFSHEIHWNSFGMRDKERALPKREGSIRIAFLGDSFTEGLEVRDTETFTRLIEKKLRSLKNDVEALNFGKGSMGTTAEFLVYTHKVVPFKPDLVVLVFFPGNDVRNNSLQLQRKYKSNHTGGPYPFYAKDAEDSRYRFVLPVAGENSPFWEFLKDHFKVYRFWRFLRDEFSLQRIQKKQRPETDSNAVDDVWGAPKTAEWREAWEITELMLSRLNQSVEKESSKLILAVLPGSGLDKRGEAAGNSLSDWRYPVKRLGAWAEKENVPIIDIDTCFLEKMKAEGRKAADLYYPQNRHFTSLGHQWTAECISEFLLKRNLSRENSK